MIAFTIGLIVIARTMTLSVASWWGGVVDAWSNFIGGIEDKVVNFVLHTVQTVTDWATTWFDDLVGRIIDVVNFAYLMAQAAQHYADSIVGGIYGWVLMIVTNLQNWTGGWINNLLAGIDNAISFTRNLVDGAEGYVIGVAEALYNQVVALFWAPLQRAFDGFVSWVVGPLVSMFAGWVADVENRLRGAYDWLIAPIINAANWIANEGIPAVRWVVRYGQMIARFIDNPIGWFESMIGNLFNNGARWFVGLVVNALNSEGSALEDWLVRWLGV